MDLGTIQKADECVGWGSLFFALIAVVKVTQNKWGVSLKCKALVIVSIAVERIVEKILCELPSPVVRNVPKVKSHESTPPIVHRFVQS